MLSFELGDGHEATRVHHISRPRGGCVAAYGAAGVTLMRKTLFGVVVAAGASMFFTVGSASADPYKWCSVESDSGGTNCGFVTIEQCRATISGKGGSCQPKQVVPHNLSPAARAAAPKTNASGSNGGEGQTRRPRSRAHGHAAGCVRRLCEKGGRCQRGAGEGGRVDRTIAISCRSPRTGG